METSIPLVRAWSVRGNWEAKRRAVLPTFRAYFQGKAYIGENQKNPDMVYYWCSSYFRVFFVLTDLAIIKFSNPLCWFIVRSWLIKRSTMVAWTDLA